MRKGGDPTGKPYGGKDEHHRTLEEGPHGGNDGDPAERGDTSGSLQYGSLTYSQFTSDYYALYTYAAFLFLPASLLPLSPFDFSPRVTRFDDAPNGEPRLRGIDLRASIVTSLTLSLRLAF